MKGIIWLGSTSKVTASKETAYGLNNITQNVTPNLS